MVHGIDYSKKLEQSLEKVQDKKISGVAIRTLSNLEFHKGHVFDSEEALAAHLSEVYRKEITSDDIAASFLLEREEEDAKLTYKNFLGL